MITLYHYFMYAGKLKFSSEYKAKNGIVQEIEGFLPLLVTVNLGSSSSPVWPLVVPN